MVLLAAVELLENTVIPESSPSLVMIALAAVEVSLNSVPPNGKVLLTGGGTYSLSREVFTNAELYDPATGTWSATGDMVAPRTSHTATLLLDGRVLVAGGGNAALCAAIR